MGNHYFASRLTWFYKTCYIKMLNVVRMPSCSFMDYNTYITWKHLEKNFGPLFQVRPKICIWPPDYMPQSRYPPSLFLFVCSHPCHVSSNQSHRLTKYIWCVLTSTWGRWYIKHILSYWATTTLRNQRRLEARLRDHIFWSYYRRACCGIIRKQRQQTKNISCHILSETSLHSSLDCFT